MNCPKCGKTNEQNAAFCAECGAKLAAEQTQQIPVPPIPPAPPVHIRVPPTQEKEQIPGAYKPLSAWAYVGWRLLFNLPFAGFVLLIVMSFAPRNKNLKSFARSYWCMALLGVIISAVIVGILLLSGLGFEALTEYLPNL